MISLVANSDIATFFEKMIPNDTIGFSKDTGKSPVDYSQLIANNLMDTDTQIDLIETSLKKIKFTPTAIDRIEKETIYYGMDQYTATEETVYGFKATMDYSQFFNHPNQVEYRVFLYPEGIKKGNPRELILNRDVQMTSDHQGKEVVQIMFEIEHNLAGSFTTKSEILFITRLALDTATQLYFPQSIRGEERWLGTLIKVKREGVFLNNFIQNKNVKSGSLPVLQDNKSWK